MNRTFKYRLKDPFGGLAADLTAEHCAPDANEGWRLQIYRNVWLVLPEGINWRDAAWLSFGLAAHSSTLDAAHPNGLTIKVDSLSFPLADFRSEVAALAMDGWVREEFDIPDRGLYAVFDRQGGTFKFHWGNYSDPFSGEF